MSKTLIHNFPNIDRVKVSRISVTVRNDNARRKMDSKRQIRLKEWGLLVNTFKTPQDSYLRGTDGSLSNQPYHLETDVTGFIKTGNVISNPGSKKKVILLGGSFVESLFAPETQRFPSQVERKLHDAGHSLQVLNGGYSGATLLHVYNTVLNKVIPLFKYTERILLFTSMSDNRPQIDADSYWIKHKLHSPLVSDGNPDVYGPQVPADTQPQFALLRSLIQLCQEFGQQPIIVLSPFRYAAPGVDDFLTKHFDSEEKLLSYYGRYTEINDTAKRAAISMGVHYIDLAKAIEGRPKLFYDTLHLNSKGHQVVADILTKELVSLL